MYHAIRVVLTDKDVPMAGSVQRNLTWDLSIPSSAAATS
jgi:hypothetical protein